MQALKLKRKATANLHYAGLTHWHYSHFQQYEMHFYLLWKQIFCVCHIKDLKELENLTDLQITYVCKGIFDVLL